MKKPVKSKIKQEDASYLALKNKRLLEIKKRIEKLASITAQQEKQIKIIKSKFPKKGQKSR